MIIKYPTGLYFNIIPQNPQDSGNVTFTISNNPPPRANLVFPKIPHGVADKKKQQRDVDVLRRRDVIGDLVFTISQSKRDVEGSDDKTFETGQILEFSDTPLKTLDPMLVNSKTEIRHDVNRIDYTKLGINSDEQQLIDDTSLFAHKNLSDQLNVVRQHRKNAEELVVANQKIINNTNRTINALQVIQDQSDTTDYDDISGLIIKLETKKNEAFMARNQFMTEANILAMEATELQNALRTVSTVLT